MRERITFFQIVKKLGKVLNFKLMLAAACCLHKPYAFLIDNVHSIITTLIPLAGFCHTFCCNQSFADGSKIFTGDSSQTISAVTVLPF